jgi:hypothetical protein
MRSVCLRLGALAVLVSGAVTLAVTSYADGAKPVPVAEIKDVMRANNEKVNGLFGLIKASLKAEPDAAAWKLGAYRAALVAEGGNILMGLTPPKGAEDDAGKAKWAGHAAAFRDCAKELLKAFKMKKYEDAKNAAAAVEKQCDSCHEDHQSE